MAKGGERASGNEQSGRTDRRVNFAVCLQPVQLVAFGAFLDLAKERHRFGFVAWFTWVVRREDHFNLDGDNVAFRLNQSYLFDSLARNTHD